MKDTPLRNSCTSSQGPYGIFLEQCLGMYSETLRACHSSNKSCPPRCKKNEVGGWERKGMRSTRVLGPPAASHHQSLYKILCKLTKWCNKLYRQGVPTEESPGNWYILIQRPFFGHAGLGVLHNVSQGPQVPGQKLM